MSSIYSEEYQHVIRLLRETRLEKGIIPYGFQDASRRQGSESPGA
ncbi:hypothetical protein [Photorhabdus luminescens]|nr:hypothetical protein [Photorhabdus luminescens]